MRVVRIYHAGRDATHRERDRALVAAGAELTLVVPAQWPEVDHLHDEPFEVVQLEVARPGDVNRHRYLDPDALGRVIDARAPDVVDLHEEPFSSVSRQVLGRIDPAQPIVGYTAQNLDKRFPPPFAQWERAALGRLDGLYPCSRQAASVAVGKGFAGPVQVLPLAPAAAFGPGPERRDGPLELLFVGRLVPEKGALDAVRVAARLAPGWPARLTVIGDGPEAGQARGAAQQLGVELDLRSWMSAAELAGAYRDAHLLLVPSRPTPTWVEQFGRTVVEAQACGTVVVGYDCGTLPEVIGEAGIVVPTGDVGALAGAVAALAEDPARYERLRAAGLAAAATRTWDAVARGQLALYEQAIGWRAALGCARSVVRARRGLARVRFGAPATEHRPFAAPGLRSLPAGAVGRIPARRPSTASAGPLRVVFLDHVARMSGGEIALARLIAATPDVEAHVVLGEDGPLVAQLAALGVEVEVLPLDPSVRDARRGALGAAAGVGTVTASARYVARLAGRLRELRPDVVHANSLKSGVYGVPAARAAGVPLLWHLRDRLAADYLPGPAARAARLALAGADLVVANSAATLATAGRTGVVLHDPYRRATAPREIARPAPTGEYTVGMLGRIARWKGHDVLLRALADVPTARVRIAGAPQFGEDDDLAALRRLVADLGLADRVAFTGHVDDVEAELAGWHVLVHASVVSEPFGQVVVEGMAAGLAVVAADAGGPAEILTDGVDGLLVPPGDPAALASALARLADPALRARLGAAAAERARAFDPDLIGPRMRTIYRAVTAR